MHVSRALTDIRFGQKIVLAVTWGLVEISKKPVVPLLSSKPSENLPLSVRFHQLLDQTNSSVV